jgi:hypothetical protein
MSLCIDDSLVCRFWWYSLIQTCTPIGHLYRVILSCTLSAAAPYCTAAVGIPLRTASDTIIADLQQQPHDFTAQRHVGPAVGVLPSQTDDSYDDDGMQIPPAQMTAGQLGDQQCVVSPRGVQPTGHCTLLMWRKSGKRKGFFFSSLTNVSKPATPTIYRDNCNK